MRYHIFGASGSGVTTLGLSLAQHLDIPYFDSDDYFWFRTDPPFTSKRPPIERNAKIRADLDAHPSWILGGSIYHWGENLFPPFDLIVFLYLSPDIRMPRLVARERSRNNKNPAAFLAWAADYDHDTGIANRTLNGHEAWLKKQTSPILELRGDLSVQERMQRILAHR